MRLLTLALVLSILNGSTLNYIDYRLDNKPNICYQTGELFEDEYNDIEVYKLNKAVKLKLSRHTPRYMVIGEVPLKFYETIENTDFYNGITKLGRLLRVGVNTQNRSVLQLTLGNLNTKEYTCRSK